MYENILPRPKSIVTGDGMVRLGGFTECRVTGLSDTLTGLLQRELPGVAISVTPGDGFHAEIGSPEVRPDAVPGAEQGFAMAVGPEGVAIESTGEMGLWYGLMAFLSLRDQEAGAEVPTGQIADEPTIPVRGIHVDLKGYQPKFPRLLEFCTLLSRYRINAVLLEVEDKYAYDCAPEVGVPGAYTHDQFRELSRHCAALGIHLIPKLQALGHVDYILKHPKYAHLREATHPFMFCPRNDEAFALWKQMADELIACFPEHRYFHIGADETANLGSCDVCKEYTKAESYVHQVSRCIDHVRGAGKEVIMWEDILRNAHGNLSEDELRTTWQLGEQTILNYWVYGSHDTLDMMQPYLDAGMKIWGASAFSGAGPTMIEDVPPLPDRARNIALWTNAAKQYGLDGVIATSWTKFRSADPPAESTEACWITLMYAAESMWSGSERDLREFVRVASRDFWGVDIGPDYNNFLTSASPRELPRERPQYDAPRNADRLALWQVGTEVLQHRQIRHDLNYLLEMYHGMLGDRLPDYIVNRVSEIADALEKSSEALNARLSAALREFYEEFAVQEVLTSRFGRDGLLVAEARKLVEATALM